MPEYYFENPHNYKDSEIYRDELEEEEKEKQRQLALAKERERVAKEAAENPVSREEAEASLSESFGSKKPEPKVDLPEGVDLPDVLPEGFTPVKSGIPLEAAEYNQQLKDPKEFGLGENLVELRNAIAKGGLDAVDGAVTAPERLSDAARGIDIGDEEYKPDWDPMADRPNPMVRTWWGSLVEQASHYGTYGAGLVIGTGGAIIGLGSVGVGMTSAALAALLSKQHDDHNLSGKIVQQRPEFGYILGALATKDTDHPLLKKFKHMVEEMGMAGTFDKLVGKLFGEKGAEMAIARNKNVTDQIVEQGKRELDEAIELVQVRDITDQVALPGAATPKKPVVKFRAHMNKPIADPWQGSPNSTGRPFDIHNQANKIDTDPTAGNGSTDSPFTAAQSERMSRENGMTDKVMAEKAREILGDVRYQKMVREMKKKKLTPRQVFGNSFQRFQEVMGRNVDGMSADEFWEPIESMLKDRVVTGDTFDEIWSTEAMVAGDLINSALFKQLRDLSQGVLEMKDVVDVFDVDGPMKTIADRLVIGLTEVKKKRYMWGETGRRMQLVKDLGEDAARKQAFETIENTTRDQINMAIQFIGKSENDKVFEGILEAMSMGNKIENWTDLDNFMRRKLHSFTNESVLLRELNGVMINSILSSVKTGFRALSGTGQVMVLQPMSRALGNLPQAAFQGAKRDEIRASLANLNATIQILPEAFTVFRKRMDSYWSGDFADMRTRYSETLNDDEAWEAMGQWINTRGHIGDQVAYGITNSARWLNDRRMLSWSPRLLAAYDDTFKFIMARANARERATLKALSMKRAGEIYDVDISDIKNLEANFNRELLDADGNIDLSKNGYLERAYKEATMTQDLEGAAKSIDTLMNQFPLVRPFYLFARTSVNGLNLAYKHTPIIGALNKKNFDILTADPNNLKALAKYGIETIDDLNAEKALVKGRQAMGTAVTLMGLEKYKAGELTGNGPADPSVRAAWIAAGWRPRSIKIGGVWVSHEILEPFSLILTTMADIGDNQDLMGERWVENKYGLQATAIAGAVSSKSYMEGINQLVDIINGEPGSGVRVIGGVLNNAVPLASLRSDFGKLITPYQRELHDDLISGTADAIRNRNLVTEQIAERKLGGITPALAIKYDVLNGKPLKDYQFWQRAINAVLPINLSIDNTSPGRTLFLESGYDKRLSVMTAPDGSGTSLRNYPYARSEYMKYMGKLTDPETGRNLEEDLNELAKRPDVQASIQDMERNRANGITEPDPMQAYKHLTLIDNVIRKAQNRAWAEVKKTEAGMEAIQNRERIEKEERTIRSNQATVPGIIESTKYA